MEEYVKKNWDELIEYKRQFHPSYKETVDSIALMIRYDETLSLCYAHYCTVNGY